MLGSSEPCSSHSFPSVSQGCVADCACILLCSDSWQKFKRSPLLVLCSSTVFMSEFACKKIYVVKGYFVDFFF